MSGPLPPQAPSLSCFTVYAATAAAAAELRDSKRAPIVVEVVMASFRVLAFSARVTFLLIFL